MANEQSFGAAYSDNNLRPAQILSKGIDHNNWQTPGMNSGSRKSDLTPAEKVYEDGQLTSNMIKQSLADLRSRLNMMKQEGDLVKSKMY